MWLYAACSEAVSHTIATCGVEVSRPHPLGIDKDLRIHHSADHARDKSPTVHETVKAPIFVFEIHVAGQSIIEGAASS